jgi:hypothetical protein
MDEIHIALLVPSSLKAAESKIIRQLLNDGEFSKDLADAVRVIMRRRPELNKVRLRISR